jgi:GTP-binding protein Era
LQIILYDTPGVIKKEMHKLDSMMMKNVRSAIGSADCVLVVADACKAPEKVLPAVRKKVIHPDIQPFYLTSCKL